MATLNYLLQGEKIYCRFVAGRGIQIKRWTGLFINPDNWNSKIQRIRDVISIENRKELNTKLSKFEDFVKDEYNISYATGEIIDGHWLNEVIKKHFNRPKSEKNHKNIDHEIYLTSYADNWLVNVAPTYKLDSGKYPSKGYISQRQAAVNNFKTFEGQTEYEITDPVTGKKPKGRTKTAFKGGNKIQFRNLTTDVFDRYSNFLRETEGYNYKTAMTKIKRIKFFCFRAQEENIAVNQNFKAKILVKKEETEYKYVYLNEKEIERLFRYDFSHDDELDNIRDLYVISLYTGLRCEDFLTHLNMDKFKDGFLEVRTQKTNTDVVIPIHPYVNYILNKRGGRLPNRVYGQKFNEKIKIIGRVVEFDNEVIGGVAKVNEKGKIRKVVGSYKKYELLSSHSGRRSMANNLFGIIPNHDICQILGWSSETMLFTYIQKTSRQSALVLQKHWENIKI